METESWQELVQAILEGEEELAGKAAQKAIQAGASAQQVLDAISSAADELGRRFEAGDCYLPELFAGAEAMSAAVDRILPALEQGAAEPRGTVVIGAVEGDVHEIGKRIVAAMLAGAGFRVHDLGTDVPAALFVEKVRALRPDIVAASAYITTTAQRLPEIAAALEQAGLRPQVKYLIGGAAVSRGMAAWAGADAYGENAAEAVAVARSLVEERRRERR